MRLVSERERIVAVACPTAGEAVHFRFVRPVFRDSVPDPLRCPACSGDHADLARALAKRNGMDGWSVELADGYGPPGFDHPHL